MVVMWNCRYTAKSRNTQASQNVRNVGWNCTELHRSLIQLARSVGQAWLARQLGPPGFLVAAWLAGLSACLPDSASELSWLDCSLPARGLLYGSRTGGVRGFELPPETPGCPHLCQCLHFVGRVVQECIGTYNYSSQKSKNIGVFAQNALERMPMTYLFSDMLECLHRAYRNV